MKKALLLLSAITLLINLNAQDIIIKKSGDEIKSKITEVGIENIKYKKFENIDGPTYTIAKNEVFMIRYENGNKDVFNKIAETSNPKIASKSEHIRKGGYLGFHVTPGAGAILMDNYKFGFGINSGIDLNIYFNEYLGIKTGVSYQRLPINFSYTVYTFSPSFYFYTAEAEGSVSSLGIPVKFLLTTGKKVGFYLESGFNLTFPISSNVKDGYDSVDDEHENMTIAVESVFGLNVKASDIISLNFGLSSHYSFMKYFPNEKSKGVLLGLQVGMLFKLSK